MKGSRVIFRTMCLSVIDVVTQGGIPARFDRPCRRVQADNAGKSALSLQAEARQATELSRWKEQIPRCREKLLRETDL